MDWVIRSRDGNGDVDVDFVSWLRGCPTWWTKLMMDCCLCGDLGKETFWLGVALLESSSVLSYGTRMAVKLKVDVCACFVAA